MNRNFHRMSTFLMGGLLAVGSNLFAQQAQTTGAWPEQVRGIPDSLGVSMHLRGKLDPTDYSVATPIEQADLERQLDQVAALGVKIVRTEIAYSWADKSKDKYDFNCYHRTIDECNKRGLKVLTILSMWDTRYDKALGINTEEGRHSFAKFCGRAASEFKGKGIIWEMWNEPNLSTFWNPTADPVGYSTAIIGAMKAMKKADPDCVIVAPSTCTMDWVFLESCFKQGLLDDVSAVSLHPYCDAPETQMSRYLQLQSLIGKYNDQKKTIPIVCTEWGYSRVFVGSGTKIRSEDEQATLVVRSILIDQMSGLPMHIIYTNDDLDDKLTWNEASFGLIRADKKTPKMSYQAVRVLIKQLSGLKFQGQLLAYSGDVGEVLDGDYVAVFAGMGKAVVALWTSNAPHEATVRLPEGQLVSVVDMNGTSLPIPKLIEPGPPQGIKKMNVDRSPVYIQMKTRPDGGIGVGTK